MMRLVFGLILLVATVSITGGFVPIGSRVNGIQRIEKRKVAALFSAIPQSDDDNEESNQIDTTNVDTEVPFDDENEQKVSSGPNIFVSTAAVYQSI